ncbi:membrane protein [Indibacter alkaliphilus LW1]|uniref:FAD:protein FMN transferase n=2 Tax=Indibacter TaxID=647744 RepID=S2DUY3_INDAL|nr:membrane protein [Indibacter alkaliphilus LW1]
MSSIWNGGKVSSFFNNYLKKNIEQMKIRAKLIIFLSTLLAMIALLHIGSQIRNEEAIVFMEGRALGVAYSLQYKGDAALEKPLDSIIYSIDKIFNIQRPDSELSRFNRNGIVENISDHLKRVLKISDHYHQISEGMVNHCMLPLIEAWGRDFSQKSLISDTLVDSLLQLTSQSNILLEKGDLIALQKGSRIDLNYIDKGYLINELSEFLRTKGVKDFQMEFGLDGCVFGSMKSSQISNFLINIPQKIGNEIKINQTYQIKNRAYSTSGNFEKFYLDELGNKHSHLIDPKSGYPIKNGILSTHILAHSAIEADAIATLTMIQNLESSKNLITTMPGLEGLIIYHEAGELKSWISSGFE